MRVEVIIILGWVGLGGTLQSQLPLWVYYQVLEDKVVTMQEVREERLLLQIRQPLLLQQMRALKVLQELRLVRTVPVVVMVEI